MSTHDARPLPVDLRVRIVQRVEGGERISAVAAEMGVLRKSVYEWRAAHRAHGAAGLNLKTSYGDKGYGDRIRKSLSLAAPANRSSAVSRGSLPPSSAYASRGRLLPQAGEGIVPHAPG